MTAFFLQALPTLFPWFSNKCQEAFRQKSGGVAEVDDASHARAIKRF